MYNRGLARVQEADRTRNVACKVPPVLPLDRLLLLANIAARFRHEYVKNAREGKRRSAATSVIRGDVARGAPEQIALVHEFHDHPGRLDNHAVQVYWSYGQPKGDSRKQGGKEGSEPKLGCCSMLISQASRRKSASIASRSGPPRSNKIIRRRLFCFFFLEIDGDGRDLSG